MFAKTTMVVLRVGTTQDLATACVKAATAQQRKSATTVSITPNGTTSVLVVARQVTLVNDVRFTSGTVTFFV